MRQVESQRRSVTDSVDSSDIIVGGRRDDAHRNCISVLTNSGVRHGRKLFKRCKPCGREYKIDHYVEQFVDEESGMLVWQCVYYYDLHNVDHAGYILVDSNWAVSIEVASGLAQKSTCILGNPAIEEYATSICSVHFRGKSLISKWGGAIQRWGKEPETCVQEGVHIVSAHASERDRDCRGDNG